MLFGAAKASSVKAAKAISLAEFSQALGRIWPDFSHSTKSLRCGLAVSGGADSMALAALFAELAQKDARLRQLHAIVVDHKLRPESSDEAAAVRRVLESLGLQARVVDAEWPPGLDKSQLRRVETTARTARYRALGRACARNQIQSLLFAHHMDDHIETTLLRVIYDPQVRSFLQANNDMPECHGLYGVAKSGTPVPVPMPGQQGFQPEQGFVEGGGVRLLRPLLEFRKERLVETCRERNVAWVEDSTNKEVTYTVRNVVRHLLDKPVLPEAVRHSSLLNMADKRRQREGRLFADAERFFNSTPFRLDPRVGVLGVQLPRTLTSYYGTTAPPPVADLRFVAAHLLRRLVSLVTNQEVIMLRELLPLIAHIFPDLSQYPESQGPASPLPRRVTVAGVIAAGVEAEGEAEGKEGAARLGRCQRSAPATREWMFRRRRIDWGNRGDDDEVRLVIKPSLAPKEVQGVQTDNMLRLSNMPFQLWDGRFWIRIFNPYQYPLIVRPLDPGDPALIKKQHFGAKLAANLVKLLHKLASGHVRYALPVIAHADGTVLSIPSLQIHYRSPRDPLADRFRVEIRYKSIDIGLHDPHTCLQSPITDVTRAFCASDRQAGKKSKASDDASLPASSTRYGSSHPTISKALTYSTPTRPSRSLDLEVDRDEPLPAPVRHRTSAKPTAQIGWREREQAATVKADRRSSVRAPFSPEKVSEPEGLAFDFLGELLANVREKKTTSPGAAAVTDKDSQQKIDEEDFDGAWGRDESLVDLIDYLSSLDDTDRKQGNPEDLTGEALPRPKELGNLRRWSRVTGKR